MHCTRFLAPLMLAWQLAPLPTLARSLPADTGEPRQLEEVVVIAQRVEESAQTTPISLVALDTTSLETLGISGVGDIGAHVPNLVIDQFPSSNQTLRLFIRGIGITDVQITQDPGVGVYLDGVYLARSTGLASEVADLERIEVLRGPQGTLYGRNTTGGALNLVTARPDPAAVQFKQTLGAGNRNQFRSHTSLNLPLGDSQAIKLAALFSEQDGFVDNTGPGGDFGDRDASGYRLDWHWQASSAITLDYAWDQSNIESHNYTPQAVIPGEPGGTPADAAILSSRRFVTYGDDLFDKLATSVPLLPTDTDIQGHALTLQWDLGDHTFKSISAWRELEDKSYIDFASGASNEYRVDFSAVRVGGDSEEPLDFDTVRTRLEQEQWSQEFQLLGNFGAHVHYVTGLYYFEEDARENWFPMHHILSFPLIQTGDQVTTVNIRAEDNRIENEAIAVYGQVTWSPARTPDFHYSLGWRYSQDDRAVDRVFRQDNYLDAGSGYTGPLVPIDFAATADEDFSDHSFSLMVEYDASDNLHGYGKYVEAYKSGGFNTRDPDPEWFERGFDEEKNRTVELGVKAEMLRRQLRFNSAVFYSDIDDLQLNFLLPGGISDTRVFNSGSATLSGFELEILAFPVRGLLLGLNYAYLHSEIDDVDDPFTGQSRSFGFSNAPRNSASLNIDYSLPLGSVGDLAANINFTYVDERDRANDNLYIDSYDLLNARLSLAETPLPAGHLTTSLWIKNALDEEYVNFTIDNLPHASRAVLWGETRTYGLELRYQY